MHIPQRKDPKNAEKKALTKSPRISQGAPKGEAEYSILFWSCGWDCSSGEKTARGLSTLLLFLGEVTAQRFSVVVRRLWGFNDEPKS
jgi:hypothetical protein